MTTDHSYTAYQAEIAGGERCAVETFPRWLRRYPQHRGKPVPCGASYLANGRCNQGHPMTDPAGRKD